MAETQSKTGKADLAGELNIGVDNPRLLRNEKTGDRARCTDPQEYHTLTSAMGYRDITDEGGDEGEKDSGASSASSGTASGAGARNAGRTAPATTSTAGGTAGTGAATGGDA